MIKTKFFMFTASKIIDRKNQKTLKKALDEFRD